MLKGKSKGYESLDVWNRSVDLALKTYRVTTAFPKEELYGMTNQIRRSSVSVSSNIAEGSERTQKDFVRFLTISKGSLAELKTQLIISHRLKMISSNDFNELTTDINEVGRMLSGLKRSLQKTSNQQLATSN